MGAQLMSGWGTMGWGGGAGFDANPPSVTVVAPASMSALTKETVIILDFDDATALSYAALIVEYEDEQGGEEWAVVYNGFRFAPDFRTSVNVVEETETGLRFYIRPRGGWVRRPRFRPIAIDTLGQLAVAE